MSAEQSGLSPSEIVKSLTHEVAELRAAQDQAQQKLKDLTRFYESELHSLNARYDVLFQKHLRESKRLQEILIEMEDNQHVKRARRELSDERASLKALAKQLVGEVQYLKKIFPIRSLLSAKDVEIKRMKDSLQRLPAGHGERKNIEGFIKEHVKERDQYAQMIEIAEKKFDQQMGELDALAKELDRRATDESQRALPPSSGNRSQDQEGLEALDLINENLKVQV